MFRKIYRKIKKFLFFVKYPKVKIGKNTNISRKCIIINSKNVKIGNNSFIGFNNVFINLRASVVIGNNVMIAPEVMFITGGHRIDFVGELMINVTNDMKLPENDSDIIINDDCWIGARAVILKGVIIGTGSVVGAGSVVTKNIPPYEVWAGNPAHFIKKRFSTKEEEIHKSIIFKKYNNKQ